MKSLSPNPLNQKLQNGNYNPFFPRSKDITPNGVIWCGTEDPDAICAEIIINDI